MEVPPKLIGGTPDKPSFGVLLECDEVEALPKSTSARKKKVEIDPTAHGFEVCLRAHGQPSGLRFPG